MHIIEEPLNSIFNIIFGWKKKFLKSFEKYYRNVKVTL